MRNFVDERAFIFNCGDAVELGLERGDALGVHGLFIHARAVEVANLLVDGVASGAASRSLLQNAALDVEVAFVEFGEAGPDRSTDREIEGAPGASKQDLRVIDVGCGSGILSIAALKLGASAALVVDIDPESIRNSRSNADTNGIGDELVLGLGSVREVAGGQFPWRSGRLVLANILAPVIIRLFEAGLAELIDPGGTIILSGILREQAQGVIEAGEAKGLQMNEKRQMGDWVALAMSA